MFYHSNGNETRTGLGWYGGRGANMGPCSGEEGVKSGPGRVYQSYLLSYTVEKQGNTVQVELELYI